MGVGFAAGISAEISGNSPIFFYFNWVSQEFPGYFRDFLAFPVSWEMKDLGNCKPYVGKETNDILEKDSRLDQAYEKSQVSEDEL